MRGAPFRALDFEAVELRRCVCNVHQAVPGDVERALNQDDMLEERV